MCTLAAALPRLTVAIFALFLVSAGTARATTFTASVNTPGTAPAVSDSGPNPVSVENSAEELFGQDVIHYWEAHASSDPGQLKVSAEMRDFHAFPANQAVATAIIMLTDLVFGFGGGGNVSVSLNLDLIGSFLLSPSASGVTSGSISLNVPGIDLGNYAVTEDPSGAGRTETATDLFAGLSGDFINTMLTTNNFSVPTNTPVNLQLILQATGGADQAGSVGISDFLLRFTTSGAVFNVPGGVTVNSADGGIVNNAYSAIPVPAALPLLGAGLAMLAALRRPRARG